MAGPRRVPRGDGPAGRRCGRGDDAEADGTPRGFTATSFCSLSLDPPLILVCLAHTSSSFAAFDGCQDFAVSILSSEHTEVARRFATSGADKFPHGDTS
ncbi:flavin reductase family protein [Streptomyces thermocarboxydus]